MGLVAKIKAITLHRHQTILSASLVLAITFAFSAILGFLRSRFLYSAFFKCCVADLDAYNAAFRLPDLIFKLLVTGALSASFIPVFASYLHKDQKQAYKMASIVINLLLIAFTVASIIVLIFTPHFSSIIAAGFTPDQLSLMVGLTRILLIAQIFFLISNFLTAILQVNQIFLIPSASPILYNFFIILSIFTLAPTFGIYGVAYGAVVGAFFHLAIQIPSIIRLGFKYSFSFDIHHSGVKEIARLMVPRSLSLGLGEIENTVTLFFASMLSAGSLSLLNLAFQIMYLPSRIFGTTVGQASLPILSKNVAKNELSEFRDTVRHVILQSLFIALPITAIILVHRLAIIRLAFGTRQFPWSATLLTAKTLAYLTPAIACQAVIQILVRSFYALHDTKTPLKISIVSLSSNIITSYLLVNYTKLGIVGLAISASIGNLVQCFGLMYLFVKIVDGNGWEKVWKRVGLILVATIISASASYLSLKILDHFILDTSKTFNVILVFGSSTLVGVISYLACSYFLKLEEIKSYQKVWQKIKGVLKIK
ncbi:MAG TPA: murein biosynthesis integral membrane protein MurJ [Candidatus Woesebacteria bacterium]|nr:murein biosynthesis integral membrane protein MurJ [Candidatus Woesebacteria bacterium]